MQQAKPKVMHVRRISAGFMIHLAFLMSLEIRTAIHFLWLRDFSNVAISREIDSIYGEMVIEFRAIRKWTHRFEDSGHSLEDWPRTDRSRSNEPMGAIHMLLVDDLYFCRNGLLSF
jgi:hypothetical protein